MLDFPSYKQVLLQYRLINKQINDDLEESKFPKERIFHLSYESLCAKPDETMRELSTFF